MRIDGSAGLGSEAPIVVGIDGSESSARALRWATELAPQYGQQIEVVYVLANRSAFEGLRSPCLADELSVVQAAGDELARTVLRIVGEDAAAEMPAVVISAENAVAGLTDASRRASFLVVGSGNAGGDPLRPGATATALLRSAGCPVVVIPSGMLGLKDSQASVTAGSRPSQNALEGSMVET